MRKLWLNIEYMSSLCHRRLRNYDEAKDNFSVISQEIERKHKDVIKK